MDSDN